MWDIKKFTNNNDYIEKKLSNNTALYLRIVLRQICTGFKRFLDYRQTYLSGYFEYNLQIYTKSYQKCATFFLY